MDPLKPFPPPPPPARPSGLPPAPHVQKDLAIRDAAAAFADLCRAAEQWLARH